MNSLYDICLLACRTYNIPIERDQLPQEVYEKLLQLDILNLDEDLLDELIRYKNLEKDISIEDVVEHGRYYFLMDISPYTYGDVDINLLYVKYLYRSYFVICECFDIDDCIGVDNIILWNKNTNTLYSEQETNILCYFSHQPKLILKGKNVVENDQNFAPIVHE